MSTVDIGNTGKTGPGLKLLDTVLFFGREFINIKRFMKSLHTFFIKPYKLNVFQFSATCMFSTIFMPMRIGPEFWSRFPGPVSIPSNACVRDSSNGTIGNFTNSTIGNQRTLNGSR